MPFRYRSMPSWKLWKRVENDLSRRHEALKFAKERVQSLRGDVGVERKRELDLETDCEPANGVKSISCELEGSRSNGVALKLAATDVFVNKAQQILKDRANDLTNRGIFFVFLTLGFLLTFVATMFVVSAFWKLELTNNFDLASFLVRSATIGIASGAFVWITFSMSRAMFHEAMVLENRRHALRFGRLSVYLKDGNVEADDLPKHFQWSEDFTSAFGDNRRWRWPSRKLVQECIEMVQKSAEAAQALRDAVDPASRPKHGSTRLNGSGTS